MACPRNCPGPSVSYPQCLQFDNIQTMSENAECVKVAVRCRPMSTDEKSKNHETIVSVDSSRGEVSVKTSKQGESNKMFTFDMVFEPGCKQELIFKQAALPIIEGVLEGYNGTIFAYGQTGTGKTHTMEGDKVVHEERGVIPRTFEHIFKSIEGTPNVQFVVQASMLELYNEEIIDLLSIAKVDKDKEERLQLHETPDKKVYVKGLSSFVISNVDEMREKLKNGSAKRHTASTNMNNTSSRSHSIFMIKVEMLEMLENGESKIKAGMLNLVDLAGSERLKKTMATDDKAKQGIYINLALSNLGKVISALANMATGGHIPYRDSKLTRLLQDSLGGNTKTIMIANIGPSVYNYDETLSTLRYAYQAKRIKNKPKINEDPKDALIREYQEEIERLKSQLTGKLTGETKIIEVEKIVKVTKTDKMREVDERLRREQQRVAQIAQEEREKVSKTIAEQQAEKSRLQQDLQAKEVAKRKEQEEQEELVQKLKDLKQKLLHGDQLKEKARLREKEEIRLQQELEQRVQKERRLKEQLENKAVMEEEISTKQKPIKEEVEQKTKKLNELVARVKKLKEQTNEIHEFRTSERQQLENQNRQLIKELKFINLLIENFIPIPDVRDFQTRLEFSDEVDDWVIKETDGPTKPNPGSALQLKAPLCEFARMAISLGDDNPRFRPDNILKLDLDLPERTTEDLEQLQISPKISETINIALNEDQEEQRMIANEKQPNVYIEDPQKMNKEEILKQRESVQRAKSAKKLMRPASGKKKK